MTDASGFDDQQTTGLIEIAAVTPAPQGERIPFLILLSGTDEGRAFKLTQGEHVVGRMREAEVQLHDEGVSRKHAQVVVTGEQIRLFDLGSTNGTWVNGTRAHNVDLRDGDRIQLGAICELKLSYQDPIEVAFTERQYSHAKRDALTGCYNKRHLVEQLRAEFSFARRHKKPLALVVIDLDNFKQVNDRYGHPVGDDVLRLAAQTMQDSLRDHDVLARFGGEELVVVMRETDTAGAMVVAERLRREVAELQIRAGEQTVSVTLSAGVASWPEAPAEDPQTLLRMADEAVYRAKAAGRNCCKT